MPIDYKLAIDTNAWTYLEANATFNSIFKANCRFKDDNKVGMRGNILTTWGQDVPQIRIEVTESDPIARGVPFVFGMNRTSFTSADVDVPIPCTARLVATMIFDEASYPKADRFAADSLVRSIWFSRYPKFGLAYCHDFLIGSTKKKETVNGIMRLVIRQTLNFNLRPKLSQLVAS